MAAPEVEEVLRIARKLDKMVTKKSMDGALDLLNQLKNMSMSLDMLQSTRIGMSVNALRKQSDEEEVITLSKTLIKSWKKLLGKTGLHFFYFLFYFVQCTGFLAGSMDIFM